MSDGEQYDLFNQPRIGAFHRDAADTERAAAIAQYPKSGTDRRKVLEAILAAGVSGLTDYEGHKVTGLRLYTYAPRRTELRDAGFVVDSRVRRRTDSESPAIVWVAAEHAKVLAKPTDDELEAAARVMARSWTKERIDELNRMTENERVTMILAAAHLDATPTEGGRE